MMKCGGGCGFVTPGSVWGSVSVEDKPLGCEQREGEKESLWCDFGVLKLELEFSTRH